jgi:glycosyltransferase involved in cell wall biosynthesis
VKSPNWLESSRAAGPRVLQVISNLDVGGAQEVVRTLAEQWRLAGCESAVATLRDGPLRPAIEATGTPVFVLPGRRHGVVALPGFAAEMKRLRDELLSLVRSQGIDVVQTHLLRSLDFLVASLKASAPVQVYWTFHNANFDLRADHLSRHRWLLGPKRRAHHALYQLCARRVDGLIAVAPDVKTSILAAMPGIPAEQIAVIPNGVDTRRYRQTVDRAALRRSLGLDERARLIAVVATLKEQKGHHILLDAAASVVHRYPEAHFLLIGDGELRPALVSRIGALGLEEHVHLLGTRHDVPNLLAASDLFALPSLWEGLAMALVEAMASGLPVVATDVSGTRQVMIDGATGLLVPPADAERLAAALVVLLEDPARAREMGVAGRNRVESQFSASRQAADHLALFHRELAAPATAAAARGGLA